MLRRELLELFIQEPSDVCIREDTHKRKFLLVVGPINNKKKNYQNLMKHKKIIQNNVMFSNGKYRSTEKDYDKIFCKYLKILYSQI